MGLINRFKYECLECGTKISLRDKIPENCSCGSTKLRKTNELIGNFLSDNEFNKLESPNFDLESEKEQFNEDLKTAYFNIIDILKEYVDLEEDYYNIIALWIIGTYFHRKFQSYPFLFFNAIKGSGKTRAMNLITTLSKDGEMLLSPTEAVLFRTSGTLGIDEFEAIERKGIESVRELINAAYKKGSIIKRMRQKKTVDGFEQVPEEFDVYRPIVMANIWGMESVLGDRCIQLILEKSSNEEITNLIEIFQEDEMVLETKKLLNRCSLCRCSYVGKTYRDWNSFVKNNYIKDTININNINNTNYTEAFKVIKLMGLRGRELELSFPLCLVALEIDPQNMEFLNKTTLTLKNIFDERKLEEFTENKDVCLLEFVSDLSVQNFSDKMVSVSQVTKKFKEETGSYEEWINPKWVGKALKRLGLIKMKRRYGSGINVSLNVEKAKEKIKIFKTQEELDKDKENNSK